MGESDLVFFFLFLQRIPLEAISGEICDRTFTRYTFCRGILP